VIAGIAETVGLPGTLGAVGITDDQVGIIVEKTLADAVTRNTPRVPSAQELEALLRGA